MKNISTKLSHLKVLDINPTTDEWMILACDGIWNFMSSQEVQLDC